MAIKVNFTMMQSQIDAARASYENLEKQLKAAQAAQDAAVAAAGGTGTDVGNAINSVLGDIMTARLDEAKTLIDTLATQITKYKTTYENANTDLVAFINTLKTKEDDAPSGNPTA